MYKNQLQELAQRSCFNLPSYTSFREGPDHAPRFKSAVNFNGETYESPNYCSTLRQAEHSAAEVALNSLASRGPTNSIAARILDETGVYKNLLQEVSQRVGATLPAYTTFRTGLGHHPVFTGTVELAGVIFTGDPAKNKKQAEKNAAMAAWLSLKSLVQQQSEASFEKPPKDEQEHVTVARALQIYLIKARLGRTQFPIKFPTISPRPSTQHSTATSSKILPLICPRNRPTAPSSNSFGIRPQKSFPAAGAAPYIPVRHCNPHNRVAPPVTIRSATPVFSALPFPSLAMGIPPPVCVRQTIPVFATPVSKELPPFVKADEGRNFRLKTARVEEPPFSRAAPAPNSEATAVQADLPPSSEAFTVQVKAVATVSGQPVNSSKWAVHNPPEEAGIAAQESKGVEDLKGLKI